MELYVDMYFLCFQIEFMYNADYGPWSQTKFDVYLAIV